MGFYVLRGDCECVYYFRSVVACVGLRYTRTLAYLRFIHKTRVIISSGCTPTLFLSVPLNNLIFYGLLLCEIMDGRCMEGRICCEAAHYKSHR